MRNLWKQIQRTVECLASFCQSERDMGADELQLPPELKAPIIRGLGLHAYCRIAAMTCNCTCDIDELLQAWKWQIELFPGAIATLRCREHLWRVSRGGLGHESAKWFV